jgi:hypothetical protein
MPPSPPHSSREYRTWSIESVISENTQYQQSLSPSLAPGKALPDESDCISGEEFAQRLAALRTLNGGMLRRFLEQDSRKERRKALNRMAALFPTK